MKNLIAVVGMHRSGTSCITGMLEDQGIYLGGVNTGIKDNLKGNRENSAIVDLHEQILKLNKSSWKNPPKTPPVFHDIHKQRRDEILQSYAGQETCAFKDPRTILLTEFWQDIDLKYIGAVRNPVAVSSSLEKRRDKIKILRGIELWKIYNSRLLDLKQKQPFPIINFDDRENLFNEVKKALAYYGLPATREFEFFDPTLLQNNISDWKSQADEESLRLWNALTQ